MLIVNDNHRLRAGVCSLNEPYPYCEPLVPTTRSS